MALPDPEMRKFLAKGGEDTILAALAEHAAAGMEITQGANGVTTLTFDGKSATIPQGQQLKLTVRAANALMAKYLRDRPKGRNRKEKARK